MSLSSSTNPFSPYDPIVRYFQAPSLVCFTDGRSETESSSLQYGHQPTTLDTDSKLCMGVFNTAGAQSKQRVPYGGSIKQLE